MDRVEEAIGAGVIRYVPAAPVPALPVLSVVNLLSSDSSAVTTGIRDITSKAGSTITAAIELRDAASGETLPLTALFRMPLRASDGRERFVLVSMVDGVATITVTLPESGRWEVTQESINSGLPPAEHMQFAGLTLYIVL
ncbi:hypothetical protein [uncultured Desulfuromonas sp.]|uniref:hypothetical protein n=1 Tax=uncultured Desulfuromonas sp. TaxID=181013 RepID=UPI002AAB0AF9|nr:hypothetical protein [uncultured Desulfuromonas sp.]